MLALIMLTKGMLAKRMLTEEMRGDFEDQTRTLLRFRGIHGWLANT